MAFGLTLAAGLATAIGFSIAGLGIEVTSSVLSYHELWNEVNPGYGSFPNAGVRLFLDRVHFRAVSGPELKDQALRYLNFLRDEEIITVDLPEDFGKMFELGI